MSGMAKNAERKPAVIEDKLYADYIPFRAASLFTWPVGRAVIRHLGQEE
jgi:hypothetical protein